MNKLLKYLFIAIGLTLCLGYAGFTIFKGDRMMDNKLCKNVQVNITDFQNKKLITKQEITDFLKENKIVVTGKYFRNIKSRKIEKIVEQHPMVRSAECFKNPDGTFEINIEQRSPVLQVIGYENYYVDDQRKVMPVSLNFAAYVPLASGRVTKEMATGKMYDFAQYLNKDTFWNAQIDQIYVNDSMKVELVPRVGNQIIILGDFDRYEKKLEKLKKLYLYGFNEIGWNRYKTIDLQFKDQVVCTKK